MTTALVPGTTVPARWLAAALLAAGVVPGQGIRGPAVAVSGGSIDVDVASNDSTVEVGVSGQAATTSHDVPPHRRVSIPVPSLPAGSVLWVTVGTGLRRQVLRIEVIAP